MKQLIIIATTLILSQISLFANSTQVFVSNTMHIELDSNTQYEKIYLGTKEGFINKAKEILSQKTVTQAAMASSLSAGTVGATRGTFKDINKGGGLIGVATIATITAGMAAYNYAVSDHEYLYITIATNNKNEKTMLYGFVVSNNSLKLNQVQNLVQNKIKRGM